eukprot:2187154-Amphidinium_carterae.1
MRLPGFNFRGQRGNFTPTPRAIHTHTHTHPMAPLQVAKPGTEFWLQPPFKLAFGELMQAYTL